jgi:hypothetical protein
VLAIRNCGVALKAIACGVFELCTTDNEEEEADCSDKDKANENDSSSAMDNQESAVSKPAPKAPSHYSSNIDSPGAGAGADAGGAGAGAPTAFTFKKQRFPILVKEKTADLVAKEMLKHLAESMHKLCQDSSSSSTNAAFHASVTVAGAAAAAGEVSKPSSSMSPRAPEATGRGDAAKNSRLAEGAAQQQQQQQPWSRELLLVRAGNLVRAVFDVFDMMPLDVGGGSINAAAASPASASVLAPHASTRHKHSQQQQQQQIDNLTESRQLQLLDVLLKLLQQSHRDCVGLMRAAGQLRKVQAFVAACCQQRQQQHNSSSSPSSPSSSSPSLSHSPSSSSMGDGVSDSGGDDEGSGGSESDEWLRGMRQGDRAHSGDDEEEEEDDDQNSDDVDQSADPLTAQIRRLQASFPSKPLHCTVLFALLASLPPKFVLNMKAWALQRIYNCPKSPSMTHVTIIKRAERISSLLDTIQMKLFMLVKAIDAKNPAEVCICICVCIIFFA